MSLQPYYIEGYQRGLQLDRKPFLLIDSAFPKLENAYVWRERLKKRQGLLLVGRLRRVLTAQSLGMTVGAQLGYTFSDILSTIGIAGQPNAELQPGSLVITIGAPDAATFTDNGDGTFAVTGVGVSAGSWVNYATREVRIVLSASIGGAAISSNLNYFTGLPVMGINQREISNINNEQTIFFDQIYAYDYTGQSFQELAPGTVWTGNDSQFFWSTNYRGSAAFDRLFFVTNFNINDPIRYFNGTTWTDFAPYLSQATPPNPAVDTILYQARILIPYYGRLLALNTYEGTESGGRGGAANYFNRCRFSQIGNPLESTLPAPVVDLAWRSDLFGRGGFIDAPTNEEIISAIFYKNTLIVFFEKTTWQLRYVGEYGLPFIWERISSDFGSESTFSPILFDQGVLGVGDRGIITSSGVSVERIDEAVPDIVFSFRNTDNGTKRVHGIRDFQKELVYWCYPASQLNRKFPNFSLIYNYRNNSFAVFRNNVTAFGYLASPAGIVWDSQDVTWDDDILWDTFIQEEYLDTVSGNQQGYIHFYGDPNSETIADSNIRAFDQESMSITSVNLGVSPIELQIRNHNLESGEIIYLVGLQFIDSVTSAVIPTDLNDNIYSVKRIDDNTIEIFRWDFVAQMYTGNFSYTPVTTPTTIYVGGGQAALFPKLNIQTKDFNPFSKQGIQCKLAYVDFLTDATPNASFSVNVYANSSLNSQSNLLIGQKSVETSLNPFGSISNISQSNPAVVTSFSPHGLLNGRSVQIDQVEGMTQINSLQSPVTVINATSFSLDNIDSSAFSAYIKGGSWIENDFPYYVEGSDYTWHRFYAGASGNFFSLNFTYNEDLMNTLSTHQQDWILNAMQLWVREGGYGVF